MSVLVVGSFIIDCVATTKVAPLAGQTVVGTSYNNYFGGKGANQAVTVKRMGSEVIIAGAMGNDDFGKKFKSMLKEEGFNINYIKTSNLNTGVSLVIVEENGQNRICMVPGANLDYSSNDLLSLEEVVKNSNIVVTQCEMQYSIVQEIAKLCKKHNVKFLLNPAPARELTNDVLENVYLITPNETELSVLVNRELITLEDYKSGALELLNRGVQNVIVTLGSRGSLLVNNDLVEFVPSYKVKAVDTVGAGDSYTGALAAMLDQGFTITEAMRIATAVGALQVQKNGAIPAIPYRKKVEEFMKNK